jgi:nitronate monooxygenase
VRAALLAAADDETVTTTVFDRAAAYPWPAHVPQRILSKPGSAPIDAGQGVGLITRARSADEVIAELTDGATRLLARWSSPGSPTEHRATG